MIMSKKHWNNQVEQSTTDLEGAETQVEQSTTSIEQSTTDVEQSAECVEGAETVQEQVAKPTMQVTMGIGQFCRYLMLNSSKSNTEILALVIKTYPDAKTTPACIAWYKSDLRKKGLIAAGDKARSTKLVELSAEELEQLCK